MKMINKAESKKTLLFLIAFLCGLIFSGCTIIAAGGTTDFGFGMSADNANGFVTDNDASSDSLILCQSGDLTVDEMAEDKLSGKLTLLFDTNDSVSYSYEFRNDTLVFMDEMQTDVYSFVGGQKGLLYGIWILEDSSDETYWGFFKSGFGIYVKRSVGRETCPE